MTLTDRKPGPWMGRIVNEAKAAQARGDFRDRSEAMKWLTARVNDETNEVEQ